MQRDRAQPKSPDNPERGRRWEFGSMLDMVAFAPSREVEAASWSSSPHSLVASGRDALRLAARSGAYRRLWLGSYGCQDLVAPLLADGVEVLRYPDDPLQSCPEFPTEAQEGDAVVLTNYFGLRQSPPKDWRTNPRVGLIEDHTHAPGSNWARASQADYCVASLRKLWPLPDGGALWSPAGGKVDALSGLAPHMYQALYVRLAAMTRRTRYLDGHDCDKSEFRQQFRDGESLLVGPELSEISELSRELLSHMPLSEWRECRRRNFATFASGFSARPGMRLLSPADTEEVPFAAMLLFEHAEACQLVQRQLAAAHIYASRLWPQDCPHHPVGIREMDHHLSNRLLALPLDMRYEDADIRRVARVLQSIH